MNAEYSLDFFVGSRKKLKTHRAFNSIWTHLGQRTHNKKLLHSNVNTTDECKIWYVYTMFLRF